MGPMRMSGCPVKQSVNDMIQPLKSLLHYTCIPEAWKLSLFWMEPPAVSRWGYSPPNLKGLVFSVVGQLFFSWTIFMFFFLPVLFHKSFCIPNALSTRWVFFCDFCFQPGSGIFQSSGWGFRWIIIGVRAGGTRGAAAPPSPAYENNVIFLATTPERTHYKIMLLAWFLKLAHRVSSSCVS